MKISILISSYNKGNYLEKCIQSCLNQNYKDYEIILIDNESTDDTESILKKYKEHITIRRTPKISKYPAVNQIDLLSQALVISSGEIICFLDADDYFEAYVFHNYGQSRTTDSNAHFTRFEGFRLTGMES